MKREGGEREGEERREGSEERGREGGERGGRRKRTNMCIMATVRGGSSIIELQELLRCQHLSQLSNLSNFTTQLSSNQIKTGSCLLTHSLTQSRFSIGVKEHV